MAKWTPFVAYIATIVLANWAISTFGIVPVGLGLMAPAGVYFAGLTFTFRNATQQTLGRKFGFLAIAIGAALSWFISPQVQLGGPLALPLASGLSFLLSETADALVWTRLRRQGWWARAMGLGDLTGQIVDSAVFLALALGSIELLAGQVIGKQWTIWPALIIMWWWRAVSQRRVVQAVA